MRKLLLSGALILSASVFAQTTLFSDNFESGSGSWTFNGSGDNAWTVNNEYLGWSPFIVDTPNQPGAITNSPQSMYMHIVNGSVCGGLGVCNANFDTGSASNQNADMASGVNTTGFSTVTVSFWYLCAGSSGVAYGSLQYSTDGGTTWTNHTNYSGVSSWTLASETNPAWANQANLKIRFKWQNGGAGLDPAFSVDEFQIVGSAGVSTSITTDNVSPMSWCVGTSQAVTVNFTATGTYNNPNIYSAQLSDASGSFASPTSIGTLASAANGSLTINATVPGSTAAGTGYRIRVVASDPATTGSDNGTDIVINPLPTVTLAPFTAVCNTDPMFTLTGGSPATGTYSGPGVTANVFDPATAGAGIHTILYTYTDGNGCSNSDQETITVDDCSSLEEHQTISFVLYPNPAEESFAVEGIQNFDKLVIIDLMGREVTSFEEADNVYDISTIPAGTYFVRIQGDGFTAIQELVKK